MTLTPNPLPLSTAGNTHTGTVTVTLANGKAPAGGLQVNFASGDTSIATVSPASITIRGREHDRDRDGYRRRGRVDNGHGQQYCRHHQCDHDGERNEASDHSEFADREPRSYDDDDGDATVDGGGSRGRSDRQLRQQQSKRGAGTGEHHHRGRRYDGYGERGRPVSRPGGHYRFGEWLQLRNGYRVGEYGPECLIAGFHQLGNTALLTLNLTSGQAPAGGLTVNLSSSAPGLLSVPASAVDPGWRDQQDGDAVTASNSTGPVTVTAAIPNTAITATANTTVSQCLNCRTITVQDASVGRNLETELRITLSQPAPAGGLNVVVTSQDPTKALLSTNATAAGAQQVSVTVPQGLQIVGVFAQGVASSGTVAVQASAPGIYFRTRDCDTNAVGVFSNELDRRRYH